MYWKTKDCDFQLCDYIYLEMRISLFIIGPIYAQRSWDGHCCQWLVTPWTIWFYNLAQPEITVSWKSRVDWWLSPFPAGSSTNTLSRPRLWNLPWRRSTGTWVFCPAFLWDTVSTTPNTVMAGPWRAPWVSCLEGIPPPPISVAGGRLSQWLSLEGSPLLCLSRLEHFLSSTGSHRWYRSHHLPWHMLWKR